MATSTLEGRLDDMDGLAVRKTDFGETSFSIFDHDGEILLGQMTMTVHPKWARHLPEIKVGQRVRVTIEAIDV